MKEEYEPFGDEWRKGMLQFSKLGLVEFYRKTCMLNKEVVERLQIANQDLLDKLSQQREEIGKENEKLLALLQMRDGGGHDADCKANYGRQCYCGHEAVKQYLRRNK